MRTKNLVGGVIVAFLLAYGLTAVSGQALQTDAATVVLYASSASTRIGAFNVIDDASAAGGKALHNPNVNAPKVTSPVADPTSFAEMSFAADAGKPYHIWIRGRAIPNSWANDSIYMQFSDSVTATGAAVYRIKSVSAVAFSLEEGNNAGTSGWMWNDNGYGGIGTDVYFAATGTHTLRIQPREDGIELDQIVISPSMFYTNRPGAPKDDSTIYQATGTTPQPPPTPEVVICGTDPTAGNLRLAWDGAENATGYVVHYGEATGIYTHNIDVGNVLEWPIPRRPDWYLTVHSYKDSEKSDNAPEVNTKQ